MIMNKFTKNLFMLNAVKYTEVQRVFICESNVATGKL